MRWKCMLLALLVLAGCTAPSARGPLPSGAVPVREMFALGLAELEAGHAEAAVRFFNAALKRDPADPFAHLAVAGAYEVQAHQGDRMARELAQVGYQQALRFDPDNSWAAYRLGVLALEDGRPAAALDWLSQAVLREPEATSALNALAAAAYLDGQYELARRASRQLLKGQDTPQAFVRNAALIAAASGNEEEAQKLFADIAERLPATVRRQLEERIRQWSQHPPTAPPPADIPLPSVPTPVDAGLMPATRSPFLSRNDAGGYSSNSNGDEVSRATMMAPIPKPAAGARARMAQIDVILIRTEEIRSARRGLNLLEGLQVQFANSRTSTRTEIGASTNSPEFERVVTRSISFPAITYSLNIANDQTDRADVLARPALVALDGQPANFFSGEEVSIPVSGNFSNSLVDKKIGIELAVTPTFLDDDTVLLSVTALRGFINALGLEPGQALRTTQQRVTTAVAVDFGQTLILSGLSESQTSRGRSGVPLLGEIPGAGRLFSSEWNEDFSKSVLILLTPRPAGATQAPQAAPSQAHGTRLLQAVDRHLGQLAGESGSGVAARALHDNPLFRPAQRRDMDLGADVRAEPARLARLLRQRQNF